MTDTHIILFQPQAGFSDTIWLMEILKTATICLPSKDQVFEEKFLDFLAQFGIRDKNSINFDVSNSEYFPKTAFKFGGCKSPVAVFDHSRESRVEISNTTGKERQSPLKYTPVKLGDFLERAEDLNFEFLDHVGFDIYWPEGAHPEILKARKNLSKKSLYFLNTTGENWDFIIPATASEITSKELDYKPIRRTKFEIVSLDYTSTPIIQFDISVKENFDQIKELFPEGYPDNFLKNVWVYIDNPYGLYICAVIGHRGKADWYRFLKKGLIK